MIGKLRLRKAKGPPNGPPGLEKKRFNLDAEALKLHGVVDPAGQVGWNKPAQPFNLEGTPVGEGLFAVYAVRGKLLGLLKVKGDIKAVTPVTPVAFDLEGAGAEVWSYDLEGVAA